jgi:hypothetical protein
MMSTYSRDFSVAIWDVQTGHRLLRFDAHSGSVPSVAFSPDGTRLVTGSADNTARIRTAFPWRTETYPGSVAQPFSERLELHKRLRLLAWERTRNQTPVRAGSRTNVSAFIGEVTLPSECPIKTQPLLPIPARDPRAGLEQIDLSGLYNAALTETWQPATSLDEVDMNLSALPGGLQDLAGVSFDVRGLIQLRRTAADWLWEWRRFPQQVSVQVGRKFSRLQVLHAAINAERAGTRIGTYLLHYADGSQLPLEIICGRDLGDWSEDPAEPKPKEAVVAWTGEDPSRHDGRSLRLFQRTYANPQPDLEVARIDFVSAMTKSGPFLVAMTVE